MPPVIIAYPLTTFLANSANSRNSRLPYACLATMVRLPCIYGAPALQLWYACLATKIHLPCVYRMSAMQLRCFRLTSSHSLLAESDNSYLPVGYYRSCQTSCSNLFINPPRVIGHRPYPILSDKIVPKLIVYDGSLVTGYICCR